MKTATLVYPYMTPAVNEGVIQVGEHLIPFSSNTEFRLLLDKAELGLFEQGMQLVHTHRTIKDGVGISINFYVEAV